MKGKNIKDLHLFHMSKEEKRIAIAAWAVGVCLFSSAMSLMLMKFGSIIATMDLDMNYHLYRWIVSAYAIFEVGMIPVAGKLVDYYGEKRVLAFGGIIFIVGAVFCSTALTMQDLVMFRALQGMGAGVIFAVAFSAVGKLYRQHKRNYAHEIMTGAFAIGSIYSTMVGWWFVDNFSWRAGILAVAGIGVVGLILAYLTLPEREVVKNIDVPGLILIGGIFFLAITYTQVANKDFPLISVQSLNFLIGEVIFILLLVYFENRAEHPAFPIHMDPTIIKYMLTMFVLCIAGIGMLQFIMKLLLLYYGLWIYQASAMFLCLLGGGAVTSMVGVRKVTTTGVRIWVFMGALLLIFGFFLLSWIGDMGIAHLGLSMIVIGLGLGCMVTQLLCSLQGIVPKNEMGVYSSTLMGIRMVGIFLGNAIFSYLVKQSISGVIHSWGVAEYGGDILEMLNLIVLVFGGLAQEVIDTFDSAVLHCATIAAVIFVLVAVMALWIGKKDLKLAEELPDNKQ